MRGSKVLFIGLAAMLVGLGAWGMPFTAAAQESTFAPGVPAICFTQIAHSDEDMLIVYHVCEPGPFFTSTLTGTVYRHRDDATGDGCLKVLPVFKEDEVLFDDTPFFTDPSRTVDGADRARRSVTDVFYKNGCPRKKDQPRSEEEIFALEAAGEVELVPNADIVNALSMPSVKARQDWELWPAPPASTGNPGFNTFTGSTGPFSIAANGEIGHIALPNFVRPRQKGFAGGKKMTYITYEICSDEQWSDTGFCSGDGVKDIFFIRYGAAIPAAGMTNIAFGTPFPKATLAQGLTPKSGGNYSPIWKGVCVGGLWEDNADRIAKYGDPVKAGVGPGPANCFGPTPQELKDFTTANNLTLSGDDRLPAGDPRRGAQLRTSADFAAVEGMNGFKATPEPFAGKLKIINCPIWAVDLNQDEEITGDEFIPMPNNVLEADRKGRFNVFDPADPTIMN